MKRESSRELARKKKREKERSGMKRATAPVVRIESCHPATESMRQRQRTDVKEFFFSSNV